MLNKKSQEISEIPLFDITVWSALESNSVINILISSDTGGILNLEIDVDEHCHVFRS
jgi:hypothetical protein